MKIFDTTTALAAATLTAGQMVSVKEIGQYRIKASGSGITLANGNVAVPVASGTAVNVKQFGADSTGATDCTTTVQAIIDRAQAGTGPTTIYFPAGDYYFEKQSGLTSTCLQFAEPTTNFQARPMPVRFVGDGSSTRIIVDNSSASTVWMAGPDGAGSEESPPVVVEKMKFVSSTCKNTTDADYITYANNYLTMTNYARIFNVGRMWRCEFRDLFFEYCKGFFNESSGEDSNNGFAQQILIERCKSIAHQHYWIDLDQAWSCTIRDNTVESGNGAIKISNSSAQSSYGVRITGNTIQGNGTTYCGIRLNHGASVYIVGNYFESNRASSGVSTPHIFMNNNTTESSITIDGNFFAAGASDLDGVGGDHYHIKLDEVKDTLLVRGNTFVGGNGISCYPDSTGYIVGSSNKFEAAGSIYNEGIFTEGVSFSSDNLPIYEGKTAWTPVLSDAVTGGNTSPTSPTEAYYTRIGDQVTASFRITNVDTAGMTGGNTLYIQGLPYASVDTQIGTCLLEQVTFTDMVCPYIFAGNSAIQLRQSTSAGNDLSLTVGALNSGTADIFVNITYRIA